jgi:hypothetical protein
VTGRRSARIRAERGIIGNVRLRTAFRRTRRLPPDRDRPARRTCPRRRDGPAPDLPGLWNAARGRAAMPRSPSGQTRLRGIRVTPGGAEAPHHRRGGVLELLDALGAGFGLFHGELFAERGSESQAGIRSRPYRPERRQRDPTQAVRAQFACRGSLLILAGFCGTLDWRTRILVRGFSAPGQPAPGPALSACPVQ